MQALRLLGLAALAAALSSHAPPASAQANAAPGFPMRCNGFNLLDKLAAIDPSRRASIDAKTAALKNGNAVFWKLEKPGTAPSYLLGTVHLTDRRVTQLDAGIKAAIGSATVLLIENAAKPSGPTMRSNSAILDAGIYTDGRSLDTVLSEKEFEEVRTATGGMPPEILRRYRPWMVSLMLSASACERQRIANGYRVQDMVVTERAVAKGIPVEGLETTEEQISALAAVPDDEQLGMLRASIALIGDSENLRETMVQLYLTRRMGALWELQLALAEKAGVPASAFASFERSLIIDRNRRMLDAALPHLEQGGAFIAVGALHLPGEAGLVELFRTSGYTATAIE
ncbi:TraB/GumN family protein [Hyphomicrobium sp.]|uniref:TraB/GumN family protein n=1 Tax=Hyphomicrobium sp. TaxID=82 RepID=UPI0025BE1DED|nr:TraB/GumN family protein [Hyphomicrobium sp.]MCC7253440.1 TraB/GumN family protein [Hyphomicrobium sp.]